jgi:hypothetical protein
MSVILDKVIIDSKINIVVTRVNIVIHVGKAFRHSIQISLPSLVENFSEICIRFIINCMNSKDVCIINNSPAVMASLTDSAVITICQLSQF